jgi:hypothetical protein
MVTRRRPERRLTFGRSGGHRLGGDGPIDGRVMSRLILNQGQQIRNPDINACLREHRRGLATVMSLVVEEVHYQAEEPPGEYDTLRVRVLQDWFR